MKCITKLFSTLTIAACTLTSCADLFENRIPMVKTGNIASLASLVVPDLTIEKLDAPAQIFVSQAESNRNIVVSWSNVPYATSYCLERAISTTKDANGKFIEPPEEDYEPVPVSHIYSTQYVDQILSNPKYSDEEYNYGFYYRVSAENPRLKYGSSDFTVSEAAYLLAPPSNVKASLGESTSEIQVTWKKAAGAKNYFVYRSTREDGSSAVFLGSVPANQNWFTNEISKIDQGVDFYYTVITKTATGESVSSSIALGYALQEGAPPKVSGVVITSGRGNTTNEINIKWDTVSDSTIHYAVYRTSSKDASYTLLQKDQQTGTYKDSKSLKPNVYYYYQVQAFKEVDGKKVKGPFSDSGSDSATPAEGFLLVPPDNIAVKKNIVDPETCNIIFYGVIGSKDYPDDSKLTSNYNSYSYNIFAGETAEGTFASIKTVSDSSLLKNSDGQYIIPVETRKFYKIVTKNGEISSAESAVCAPAPFAAENLVASKAANVGGAANDNGVLPVKVTWTPPQNDEAAGGYYVYRSTSPTSGFKKITDEPVMGLSYVDANENAKAGAYYYYKVLSLNSLGQGANYTDPQFGYGALTPEQYMREYNKTVMNSQKKLKLMHKAVDTDKLGSESASGKLSGSLSYNASLDGLGARILMHYSNYADFYANGDAANGYYFFLNGDTNTKASMDASGTMDGTVVCTGMYPGAVVYNNIQIKGGGAAGGTYGIRREGFSGQAEISWQIGEEGR